MGNIVLYMSVRQHLSKIIPESSAIVISRPDSLLMVSIALTLQKIITVSCPFIVRPLACGLMPVVPVLSSYEVSVDIMVSITFF